MLALIESAEQLRNERENIKALLSTTAELLEAYETVLRQEYALWNEVILPELVHYNRRGEPLPKDLADRLEVLITEKNLV